MTAIHAVRVRPDFVIDNVLDFANQAAIDAANVQSYPFKWIGNNNWVAGMDPLLATIGNVWNGIYPATFAAPVVVEPDPDPAKPTTLAEAQAIVLQRQAEADVAGQAKADADAAERQAQADLVALIPITAG